MRAETLCVNRHRLPSAEVPCAECVAESLTYPPAPAVRTMTVNGLEFEVPTWDPAPTPWFAAGSWAKDPEQTERLRDAIRAAVPNHEVLVAQALTATGDGSCRTFWGSHGCSLTADHWGLHVCGTPGDLCSAGLPWGRGDTLILWWDHGDGGLTLSALHWTWFR